MAAMFDESESGEILSPIIEPATTAPKITGSGTSRPIAIPISAIPAVPADPHDVPVAIDNIVQIKKLHATRKRGFIICIP